MFLVLLGLCTGLFELQFSNPRLGLAAHLEGVMNGILLLAFGAAWMEIHLGTRAKAVAYWTALYGAYSNWAFTVLAATLGTMSVSPIASGGRMGEPWQESLVTAGFGTVGVAIIVAVVLMLWGLSKTTAAH
jgi:hydroxylaminobenzene mutase